MAPSWCYHSTIIKLKKGNFQFQDSVVVSKVSNFVSGNEPIWKDFIDFKMGV
jgi:hypothetical protein